MGIGPGIGDCPLVPLLDLRLGQGRLNTEGVLAVRVEEWSGQSIDQVRRIEPVEEECPPVRPVERLLIELRWVITEEQGVVITLLKDLLRCRDSLRELLRALDRQAL